MRVQLAAPTPPPLIHGVKHVLVRRQKVLQVLHRQAVARHGDVSGMVVRQGLTLAGIGVAVGLVAAFGLTRLMSSLLYGVEAVDAPTFGAVALVLTAGSAVASWLPAHRAAGVDPAVTLREE